METLPYGGYTFAGQLLYHDSADIKSWISFNFPGLYDASATKRF